MVELETPFQKEVLGKAIQYLHTYLLFLGEYLGRYIHFMAIQKGSSMVLDLLKTIIRFSICATKKAARTIMFILDHYCKISGQLVNYHKSKIQFLMVLVKQQRSQ